MWFLSGFYPPFHAHLPWYSTGGEFYWAWFLQPQSEFATDGVHLDVLLPNFIISFENLQSDFKCMATLLGLSAKLGHKNPSRSVEGEWFTL